MIEKYRGPILQRLVTQGNAFKNSSSMSAALRRLLCKALHQAIGLLEDVQEVGCLIALMSNA